MKVNIIAAISENDVIGWNGKLPWKMKSDLQEFRRLTMGHHVIMGRKTFESIGMPLPGRKNVVITRQHNFSHDEVTAVASLDDAIAIAFNDGDTEAFIIGGSEVFRNGLSYADTMYITRIHCNVFGDTYFPPVNWDEWIKVYESELYSPDENNIYPFSFETYVLRRE